MTSNCSAYLTTTHHTSTLDEHLITLLLHNNDQANDEWYISKQDTINGYQKLPCFGTA